MTDITNLRLPGAHWGRYRERLAKGEHMPEPMLVDVRTMAEKLSLCESKIRRMVKAGEIPFLKIGGAYRFNPTEVLAHLQSKQ